MSMCQSEWAQKFMPTIVVTYKHERGDYDQIVGF